MSDDKREEGAAAFETGVQFEENPYPRDTQEHDDWADGWSDRWAWFIDQAYQDPPAQEDDG